jgi:hypothetical protein
MPRSGRRRFLELLAATATALRGWREAAAQAPPKAPLPETDPRRRELAAALRELNAKAGLRVTAEDLDRAEAYATGALLEAETKLRSLTLPEGLDLPLVFHARRRP